MTKQEFIKKLFLACPAFRQDLEEVQRLLANLEYNDSDSAWNDAREKLTRRLAELEQKWPRAKDLLPWPTFSEWSKEWNSNKARLTTIKSTFSSVMKLGQPEQIELDPWLMSRVNIQNTIETLTGQTLDQAWLEELAPDKPTDQELVNFKTNLRENAGGKLFSRAAIVIPIYPETNKDDIDWNEVERLKKLAYGFSYRRRESAYEMTIKIFAAGQLLELGKGYTTWKEVADSVGKKLNTTRYFYDRAHSIVYGSPANKRPYEVAVDLDSLKTVKAVQQKKDPSQREKQLTTDRIEKWASKNNLADLLDDRDQCFKCDHLGAVSAGKYLKTVDQHRQLSQHMYLPEYPGYVPFLCGVCLDALTLPSADSTDSK